VALQGDLLLTVKGAGIGKTNILKFEEAAISRQLMAVRAVGLHRDFLALVLESIREDLRAAQVGIAIPGIGRADVEDIELLLPPESEQERIVATVDELMRTCDDLELALLERSDVTRRLATAATRAEAF
jgi:type I restriction enzyme S subunit